MSTLFRSRCRSSYFLIGPITTVVLMLLTVPTSAQFYKQTNLVSDIPGLAAITDPSLVNPWGVSFTDGSPFWVSNQGTNTATLYSVNSSNVPTKVPLTVSVPGGPTGQVFNPTPDFKVPAGSPTAKAFFIFATLGGQIRGWNPGVAATLAVLGGAGSPPPAVYTGLEMATRSAGPYLYAANVAAGRIDVFDKNYVQVALPGTFTDPGLPPGNTPFNIANIGGRLYVTYSGPSGIVNVFDVDGNFVKRFATGGTLKNPWGMALAPADFGTFSNALLIGNFNHGNPANGPGWISAFDAATGAFLGLLRDDFANIIAIDGLWSLKFGNGGNGGKPNYLYFSAGIQDEDHGLFGSLQLCHGPVITNESADPNSLWPPNHKMVLITVSYDVSDDCDPNPVCDLTVSSNEPPMGGGSGHTSPDWQVVDAHHVYLRAERAGTGDGRVYTVTITCTDRMGLTSQKTVTVTVPHDKGK